MNIKPLTFLGDISYSLYLIHSIVLIVFLGLIKRINLNSNSDQILWLFIEVVVAILAAYLFFYLRTCLNIFWRDVDKLVKGI